MCEIFLSRHFNHYFSVQINRERVGTFVLASEGGYRDVAMIKDCDTAVKEICELCGWSDDLKRLTQPEPEKPKPKREQPSSHKQNHKTGRSHTKKK